MPSRPTQLIETGVMVFGRAVIYTIMNVYAIRMAGVFMISLGTIWIQTRVVPRLFVFLTYGLALVLLVTINFSLWVIFIFPIWVLVISIIILRESWRGETAEAEGLVGTSDGK